MAKKPFYKRKRLWIPLLLFVLILTPFLINPIKSFRKTTSVVLRVLGIHDKTLVAGRYRFHYYEGGQDNPQKVILLHGFGGNAIMTWMQLLPPLARRYHVYAPDLLASNLFRLNPYTYSIDQEEKLVLAFMDALGIEKASLVGLSAGGWVSLLLALEHPQRVDKLILIESAGLEMEVPELVRLVLTDREKAKLFMKMVFHNPPPLPGFVLDQLVRNSLKVQKKYQRLLKTFLEKGSQRTLDGRLAEIPHPTLVLHGRQDQVVPLEIGEKLHRGLPNSELIILENSGHAAVWDSPWKLRKHILEFLGRPNLGN